MATTDAVQAIKLTVDSTREELERKEEENRELQTCLKQLEVEFTAAKGELAHKDQIMFEADSRIRELKKTIGELGEKLAKEHHELVQSQEDLAAMKQQVESSARVKQEEKNRELQARLKQLEVEYSAANGELIHKDQLVSEADSRIRELKKWIGELGKKLAGLKEENKSLEEKIRLSYEEKKGSEQQVRAYKRQVDSLNDKVRELNQKLQLRQDQLDRWSTKIIEFQSLKKEYQEQIEEKEKELRQEKEHVREKDEQAMELQRRHEQELQRRQEEKERELQEKEASINLLRERFQQKQVEIQSLRDRLENRPWVLEKGEVVLTDEKLGGGAYGEVRVAIFRGTRVAAKCLHQLIVSDYNRGVFTREMEISSRIHHPNIVQFVGATRVNNPILLYELMATSLHSTLQNVKSLTNPQIIDVCFDIASALCYLHLWKPDPIIHRDVSSPNVLMEPLANGRWRSKLSDFGSANLQLQVKTVLPGNPAYASPEARDPQYHSPAMDIYSFGVLGIEMVLHCPPELDGTKREQQARSIDWNPMRVIVLKCINPDRTQRPTSLKVLGELKLVN